MTAFHNVPKDPMGEEHSLLHGVEDQQRLQGRQAGGHPRVRFPWMSYFDGNARHEPLHLAVGHHLEQGRPSGECDYFSFTCHKKGTIHLTFRDDGILRRFNLVACRGKGWLPSDYGTKQYRAMDPEEKAVVDSFEGKASYQQNRRRELFAQKQHLCIAAPAKKERDTKTVEVAD